MNQGVRKKIGRGFMIIGLILVVIGVTYQLINIPWRPFLLRMGFELSQEIADPAPLPQTLVAQEPAAVSSATDADINLSLPDPAALTLKRGNVTLEPVGIVKIPRLGISENVVEGSDEELLYAVGHIRGTAMPGEEGNCVLAGHRNFIQMHPFMHLDMAEKGDQVTVEYNGMIYTYEVYNSFYVYPSEVWVTAPQEGETSMLTLLTCSPGMNPTHRVVVWCRLVSEEPSNRKLPTAAAN